MIYAQRMCGNGEQSDRKSFYRVELEWENVYFIVFFLNFSSFNHDVILVD